MRILGVPFNAKKGEAVLLFIYFFVESANDRRVPVGNGTLHPMERAILALTFTPR